VRDIKIKSYNNHQAHISYLLFLFMIWTGTSLYKGVAKADTIRLTVYPTAGSNILVKMFPKLLDGSAGHEWQVLINYVQQ
jgi:hypothetical protein